MNTAEIIADKLDNDGTRFETEDGVTFDELVKNASVSHYTNRDAWEFEYRSQTAMEHCEGDVIAYKFADGSRIIQVGVAWDVYDDNGWGIVLDTESESDD